jgi:hypothetical protein
VSGRVAVVTYIDGNLPALRAASGVERHEDAIRLGRRD